MENSWKEDIIQNRLGEKREWNEKERTELCHQLDKELNAKLDSLSKNNTLDGRWTEENWKEKMAEHPIFAPCLQGENPKGEGEAPLNDLTEGLAQLKYSLDHNTPLEVARDYKAEGVHYFKLKKYRFAVASFSEGLKANCSDKDLDAQLYNNRAAADYHLENFRSSLQDCMKAVELKPDYLKAVKRGIDCAEKVKAWDQMFELCQLGLSLESDNDEWKSKKEYAKTGKDKQWVEKRRKEAAARKQLRLNKTLLTEIVSRGIEVVPSDSPIAVDEENPSTLIHNLKPQLQPLLQSFVYLDNKNELVWPVLFKYPEYYQTDFIFEFNENSRFIDHFEAICGPETSPASWDVELKYRSENLIIYYTPYSEKRLVSIDPGSTLKEVSAAIGKLEVKDGTLTFLVLVKGSKFVEEFIQDYC